MNASTIPGGCVHHIRLGQKLKEAMTKLRLECAVAEKGETNLREF